MLQNLVGSAMLLFCLGQKFTIGSTFLYIMSYFRLKNENTILADTTIIGIVAMSTGFCALISIKCQQHFGLKNFIRVLAVIDTSCQFISSFIQNDTIFLFTYILIPMITGLGFMYMPIINNVWRNHTQQQGKITGNLLGFMGIGQIFFILFGTYYMNPNNLPATIEVKNDDQVLKFFDNQVCQNVPSYILLQSFIFLFLQIPGSLLISSKDINDTTIHNNNNDVQMELNNTSKNFNFQQEFDNSINKDNSKLEQNITIIKNEFICNITKLKKIMMIKLNKKKKCEKKIIGFVNLTIILIKINQENMKLLNNTYTIISFKQYLHFVFQFLVQYLFYL